MKCKEKHFLQLKPSCCLQYLRFCVWLTVLLSKLLRFLIRDVPLGLQVCFVSYKNDHLSIQRQNRKNETILLIVWSLREKLAFPKSLRAKNANGSIGRLLQKKLLHCGVVC